MCATCDIVLHMSKMIQIRNVPDEVHREVKSRAAMAGMSLSDYLLRDLQRTIAVPSPEEVMARVRGRARPSLPETPAEAVRLERSNR